MEDFSRAFQIIIRALYVVAQRISDVPYRERLKSEIFLFVESYFRRDVSSFKEHCHVIDFFLKTAVDLRFTAEENYAVLYRELGVFTNKFVTHLDNEHLVSGIPELTDLFPETMGNDYGINLPIRVPKIRSVSRSRTGDPTERQHAILELLREKGSAPLMDFLIRFPELNEKTIRNDLNSLCVDGYATRIGKGGRGSRYQFVRDIVVT